ncbi:ATP-binding protein [Falsiroseomonas sp. HW251]|uniref:ATP-binding protein n=1 Tax=Falsiroseomonas sp. HW251 TaxID=3390998 RepID=UPI003D312E8E
MLLVASLLILAAPLAGIWLLRIYESALVRQTETELIGQAAVIAAAYRTGYAGPRASPDGEWAPRPAMLDLARDTVLPSPAPARPVETPPDPRAREAGAALQPVLAEAQRTTLAAMRILDARGIVVASSGGDAGLSLADQKEVSDALAGRAAAVIRARVLSPDQPTGSGGISRAAAIRVFVAQPVTQDGRVIGAVLLSRTPVSLDQALRGKRAEIAIAAAILLLLAGAVALFTATTVSRPIQAVTAQARAVAAGGALPEGRVRGSVVREADELSAAIHAMAATLKRRADYIEGFATEVSHEFKTPLAALRGALELLRDHGPAMTEAERDRFLSHGVEDVQRLDRLVRRLLDLARAEAPQPRAPASCALRQTVEQAAAPHRAAGLAVAIDLPAIEVALPAETLRAIVANLLDNVRQHAGAGAAATIAFEGERDGMACVLVSDDGAGVSEGNAARIFDRFFTTAREAGGTGLGLPLVRSSLEAAGGGIELARRAPGAAFRLRLRLAR